MICTKCGLPKELCVCETIAKESQSVRVARERKKFGKIHTVIDGIDTKDIDIKELIKKLKNTLACGGTAKLGRIDLSGDHLKDSGRKLRAILVEAGFPQESIDVSLQIR